MDFVKLTPQQSCAFDQDGFLVVPGALPADTLEQVVDASDRLAAAFLKKPHLLDRPEYNHLDLRPGLLREPAFVSLVAHASTVSLVVQLLSPNIHLHSTALIYKKPENTTAAPFRRGWHRDIRIPRDLGHHSLPRVGIKVCYCLTDFIRAESGMTLMARGSHLRSEPLAIGEDQVDPAGVEVCDLHLHAGDALLFENRIFHTAAPNRSERTSKVVMFGYAYRWMKPEIYLDTLDQEGFERADPVTRQLLGGYRDIDTPAWALERWARKNGVQPEAIPWTVSL